MKKHKRLAIKDTIFTHVQNNSKEYIIVTLIFIIGLFLGVMFIFNKFYRKIKKYGKFENWNYVKNNNIRKHCVSNYPVVFWNNSNTEYP